MITRFDRAIARVNEQALITASRGTVNLLLSFARSLPRIPPYKGPVHVNVSSRIDISVLDGAIIRPSLIAPRPIDRRLLFKLCSIFQPLRKYINLVAFTCIRGLSAA